MLAPNHPINRLRRIAARLAECGDDEADWFSQSLAEYESGARLGLRLDEALGMSIGRGRTAWFETEANAQRDRIIREMAIRFFPNSTAREIAAAFRRYEGGEFRRHRGFKNPPPNADLKRRSMFRLLKSCIHGAPSERTVRRALSRHENDVFMAAGL